MKRRTFLIGGGVAVAATAGMGVVCSTSAAANYAKYSAHLRRPLEPAGGIAELVRMATLAPNGHNTQAWRFWNTGNALAITADFSRRTPVVDPDDHHIYVSLGAATENILLAGATMGMEGRISILDNSAVLCAWERGLAAANPLADAIVKRQSTRTVYDGSTVAAADLKSLTGEASRDGVRLVLITERSKIDAVRDLIIAGNDAQMDDPAFVTELKSWLRFSAGSAIERGDGLYAAASGNPSLPDFLGRPAFDLVFKKSSEAAKYRAQIDSSAGLAVFFADHEGPRGWIDVGRAAQRFLLEATRQGLACAFVNQPVEVKKLRPELAALAGEKGLRPDLVIRFGRAKRLPYSPRRNVPSVMA